MREPTQEETEAGLALLVSIMLDRLHVQEITITKRELLASDGLVEITEDPMTGGLRIRKLPPDGEETVQ